MVKIVILAAGKGTRMGGELPKVLTPVLGRPMVLHLLESVQKARVLNRPVLVVGYQADKVKAAVGDGCDFVYQAEQLGTGHAVSIAQEASRGAEHVLVLYGDHPLISEDTITKIFEGHQKSGATITMATISTPDFEGWKQSFYDFGRIIRDESGNIIKSIEKKDATEEQKQIKEVNPCYYCFDAKWLWESLSQLKNNNAQGEYYLTDVVETAFKEGKKIHSIAIPPHEGLGVNTPEQLKMVEQYLTDRK